MKWPNFIGPSYVSANILSDQEELINWYLEVLESPGAKNRFHYLPTPGQETFVTVADVGTRALFNMNDITRAVVGPSLYALTSAASSSLLGAMVQDSNPATISYNGVAGNRLMITTGGNVYYENLTTNVVTQVSGVVGTMGGMMDGYFIAFNIGSATVAPEIRISPLNDGTGVWDPTQFQQRSIAPDPWRAMVLDGNRQMWLIGEQTSEVWTDFGTFPFPFAPIPGAVIKSGTCAPFSAAAASDRVLWLEQTSSGAGKVVAAKGYSAQRVSSHAVEEAIAGYARSATINDAEALCYQDQGHEFYILNFPAANASWAFDLTVADALGPAYAWHRRGVWVPSQNQFSLWAPRVHCYAFGRHLVGTRGSTTIATMDTAIGSELDGSAIRRMRRAPGLFDEHEPVTIHEIEFYFETGLGLQSGQGSDPIVMLNSSRDGGRTWGNERRETAGRVGAYRTRVTFGRCGTSRDRVFEVTVSDPTPWRLTDAFVKARSNKAGRAA
jgi:hypothetical protein